MSSLSVKQSSFFVKSVYSKQYITNNIYFRLPCNQNKTRVNEYKRFFVCTKKIFSASATQ